MTQFAPRRASERHEYVDVTATLPAGAVRDWQPDPALIRREALRDAAVRWGLREVITPVFADPTLAGAFDGADPVIVDNPLKSATKVLRTSLLPGLLATVRANVPRVDVARLFELGVVAHADAEEGATEHRRLGILLWGHRSHGHGDGILRRDIADAVCTVLRTAGFGTPQFVPGRPRGLDPRGAAAVQLAGRVVGVVGAPDRSTVPDVSRLARPVVAELDVAALAALPARPAVVRPLPSERPIELDVTLAVPAGVLTHQVVDALVAGFGGVVERVVLVDEYQGPGIDDRRSVTVRVWLGIGASKSPKAEAAGLRDRAVEEVRAWLDGGGNTLGSTR